MARVAITQVAIVAAGSPVQRDMIDAMSAVGGNRFFRSLIRLVTI
jgi:hypothetical protein